MWFDMVRNHNKKSFKVVMIPVEESEIVIAKTEHYGFAIDIAKHFDERFKDLKAEYMIEVR